MPETNSAPTWVSRLDNSPAYSFVSISPMLLSVEKLDQGVKLSILPEGIHIRWKGVICSREPVSH